MFLENNGYVETKLGGLTLYQGFLYVGGVKTMPILVRIEGNRIFAAMAGSESYAEALITGINS